MAPASSLPPFEIRHARLADVEAMAELINGFARRNYMLSRTTGELYETIRDFLIIEEAGERLVGCAALHVVSAQIAELKSLAVADGTQGRGYGRELVCASLREAGALGLQRVFCLTYQEAFFERLGFVKVDRSRLPEKVWGECVRCNKFLNCDEVSMWAEVHVADDSVGDTPHSLS